MIQFERGTVLLTDQHLLSSDSKLDSTTDTLAKLEGCNCFIFGCLCSLPTPG